MTSLLAMLYVVLFAALALGFFAQTTLNAQISANERNQLHARLAAESGVSYMRYRLNQLKVKYCPPDQLMKAVFDQLLEIEKDQGNLAYGMQEISLQGAEIIYPRDPHALINLGERGSGFRARISRVPGTRSLLLKVAGYAGGKAGVGMGGNPTAGSQVRGIEYVFRTDEIKAPLFDYGVAGRGQIEVAGSAQIRGAVPAEGNVYTSTGYNPAVLMTGPSKISGDVYLAKATATYSYGGGSSVANGTDPAWKANHTHRPWPAASEPPVEFPEIDTADFIPYATTIAPPVKPLGTYFKNIRIPPGRGTVLAPYVFSGGTKVEGVLYIQAPNVVRFDGNCTITGVVVGDNVPLASGLANNIVEFSGTATAYDVSKLPEDNPVDFPEALREMKGSSIVLPGFHVKFSGGHGAVSGSVASDQLTFTGNSTGTITGAVIGLAEQRLVVSGSGVVQVQRPPAIPWPAGMKFRHRWLPRGESYRELDRVEAKKI